MKFASGRVESIVRKGGNARNQQFLLFPQCFQKPSFSGSLKVGLSGIELGLHLGFCPGCALALKDSRWCKKPQMDGPEGAPNFSNQKTKSDFHIVVVAFQPSSVLIWFPALCFVNKHQNT